MNIRERNLSQPVHLAIFITPELVGRPLNNAQLIPHFKMVIRSTGEELWVRLVPKVLLIGIVY